MFKRKTAEKGVVLLIVLGTVLVVSVLTTALLTIIFNQSRLTHHQISRIQAYYAGVGIMNYAQEQLRKGVWEPNPDGVTSRYVCFKGCIDDSVSPFYPIDDDADIPYKVQVKIYPLNTVEAGSPLTGAGVTQIEIKTDYTYTP